MKKILILAILMAFAGLACQSQPTAVMSPVTQAPPKNQAISPEQPASEIKSAEELQQIKQEAFKYMDAQQYAKALECFQKIIASFPNDAITTYNIACTYSLLRDKANALAWLKKAIDGGYRVKKQMAEDTDLDFIRNDKEFQTLMDGIK